MELKHYGVLGMKWGVRRTPEQLGHRTGSRKKTGSKTEESKSAKKALSDKQKKALKVAGITLAVTGTIVVAKKTGALDKGRNLINQALNKCGDTKVSQPQKHISETINESLEKANPLRNSAQGCNNCIPSSIAGILRTMGYDATAKSTGGKMLNPGGTLEECFKNIKVLDGSATKFAKSPADAASMIQKRFGDNAKGVCSIQWKNGGGHCFSWITENGKTSFMDFQKNDNNIARYWSMIKSDGALTLAQIGDDVEIDFEKLAKFVDVK